jgi:hypothetical protein
MHTGTAASIQSGARERRNHRECNHRAYHHHLAMGEVDQLDNAVDHGVTQRDHGVDAAQRESVDNLLQEDVHAWADLNPKTRRTQSGSANASWLC